VQQPRGPGPGAVERGPGAITTPPPGAGGSRVSEAATVSAGQSTKVSLTFCNTSVVTIAFVLENRSASNN
jgi:hypothetical protein